MKHIQTSHYIWLLPFLCFLSGYQLLNWFYHIDAFEVPHIVGMHIQPALTLLTQQHLHASLISEKEDVDLPGGTIISQSPHAGSMVKPNQSIFIVVSKRPSPHQTPLVIQKESEVIAKEMKALGIKHKTYALKSVYPKQQCFAQYPAAGELLSDKKMTLYVSAGNSGPVLMPDLRKKPLTDVIPFLEQSNIKPDIVHQSAQPHNHSCASCIVTHQRPLPGSLVSLNDEQTLHVHLMVA